MNAFLDRFGGANMLDMIRAEIGSPIDHDSGLD
jgi:hypothetical protein